MLDNSTMLVPLLKFAPESGSRNQLEMRSRRVEPTGKFQRRIVEGKKT